MRLLIRADELARQLSSLMYEGKCISIESDPEYWSLLHVNQDSDLLDAHATWVAAVIDLIRLSIDDSNFVDEISSRALGSPLFADVHGEVHRTVNQQLAVLGRLHRLIPALATAEHIDAAPRCRPDIVIHQTALRETGGGDAVYGPTVNISIVDSTVGSVGVGSGASVVGIVGVPAVGPRSPRITAPADEAHPRTQEARRQPTLEALKIEVHRLGERAREINILAYNGPWADALVARYDPGHLEHLLREIAPDLSEHGTALRDLGELRAIVLEADRAAERVARPTGQDALMVVLATMRRDARRVMNTASNCLGSLKGIRL